MSSPRRLLDAWKLSCRCLHPKMVLSQDQPSNRESPNKNTYTTQPKLATHSNSGADDGTPVLDRGIRPRVSANGVELQLHTVAHLGWLCTT